MTKNVRTIPATVNLFNNTPINSMKKGELQLMQEYQQTKKNN